MTVQKIFEYIVSLAGTHREETGDGLVIGDPAKEVCKAATCFKLTAEVLQEAIRQELDMVITHEPTFSHGDNRSDICEPYDVKKLTMLENSGIALYRFHDYAHDMKPDLIHQGFLSALGLPIQTRFPQTDFAVSRWEISESIPVRELAQQIQETLGVEFVRVIGDDTVCIKTLGLGLGNVGFKQLNYLFEPGCDAFITGEIGEVLNCEYIRDACFFGEKKALLILGHYSSEYAGMRMLAEILNRELVPTVYLDSGEVYHKL